MTRPCCFLTLTFHLPSSCSTGQKIKPSSFRQAGKVNRCSSVRFCAAFLSGKATGHWLLSKKLMLLAVKSCCVAKARMHGAWSRRNVVWPTRRIFLGDFGEMEWRYQVNVSGNNQALTCFDLLVNFHVLSSVLSKNVDFQHRKSKIPSPRFIFWKSKNSKNFLLF